MLKCFGAALVKNTVNQEPLRYSNQASYKNLRTKSFIFLLFKNQEERIRKEPGEG